MESKNKWATKSLAWIHKVREKIDKEIQEKGLTLADWVRFRSESDVASLCYNLGIRNFKVVKMVYPHTRSLREAVNEIASATRLAARQASRNDRKGKNDF